MPSRQQRKTRKQEASQQFLEVIRTKLNATLSELAIEIGQSKSTIGGYLSKIQVTQLVEIGEFGWNIL